MTKQGAGDGAGPRASYDRVAGEYERRIAGELAHKPFDRERLRLLAGRAGGRGPIADLGCGPAHVGAFLNDCGARAIGVDLSLGLLRRARARLPDLPLVQCDLRRLAFRDGAWAAIAAFYSLIHVPRDEMVATLRELRRALARGGWLLAAFHVGGETLHLDEWWGHAVSLDFHFFEPGEMRGWLSAAGFDAIEIEVRDPYPDVEHPSRRAYAWGRAGG